ncbi:hypothetical protein E4T56_gene2036 [Termitomyces sp. T112]|nr:hypothetical protein E4T56_gene2036 [Termitomyces sp. T112]
MFAHINTVYLSLAFALCASGTIVSVKNDETICSNGFMRCCNEIAQPDDVAVTTLAYHLGIIDPITSTVGLNCAIISELGW